MNKNKKIECIAVEFLDGKIFYYIISKNVVCSKDFIRLNFYHRDESIYNAGYYFYEIKNRWGKEVKPQTVDIFKHSIRQIIYNIKI